MEISKSELELIAELGNGIKNISELVSNLKKSKSQVYRLIEKLKNKNLIQDDYTPNKQIHVNILFKMLAKRKNLAKILSGSGIQILLSLIEPKKVKEIQEETKLHKTTILHKISQGRSMSLFKLQNHTYSINQAIWPEIKDFVVELTKYENSIDERVPTTSQIYFKNEKEILFSTRENLEASLTAFSAYENFGIKLYTITNYYYLPSKKLTKKEILLHSLLITEKEFNIQNIILISLFYLKYKINIKHPIIKNIKEVLKGNKIKDYPSLREIQDRAEIYDIKV